MVEVRVRYRDEALVALVVQATREVDGVVGLQRRPVTTLTRRLVAAARQPARPHLADATAVELLRDADGSVDVSVRLVSRLEPAPRQVILDVVASVRRRLLAAGEAAVRVQVTVTDVRH